MYPKSKNLGCISNSLFSCMFCFPNLDHVMFSRKFAFCLFINYAYNISTWMHVHGTTLEKGSSLG